jgi:hypothetical membrane protein
LPDGAVRPTSGAAAAARRLLHASDRTTGFLGLFGAGLILLAALVTAIPYRGWAGEAYSPLNHFISELGELERSQLAPLFDAALVIGSVSLMLFLYLLSRRATGPARTGLAVAGLLAGLGGLLVGVFPMDTGALHRIVSGVFFLTSWLVAGVFTLWLARTRSRILPRWLLAPAVLAVVVDLVFVVIYTTYRPAHPDAHIVIRDGVWIYPLLEWASLLSLLVWILCTALVLLRRPHD